MRKYLLCILIAFGCTSHKYNYDIVRKIPKQKLIPPGTVWLRDNLFIDETEISNFSWLEYTYWVKRKQPDKYNSILPDTACWAKFDLFNSYNLQIYYLKHPAYRNFPVVGISYEQAVDFCKWRSLLVNNYIYINKNKVKNYPIDTIFKTTEYVRYRLPTKEEWEYAAAAGLDFCKYPMGYEKLTDKNNIPVSNTLEYFNYYTNIYKNVAYKCGDTMEVVYPTEAVYFGKPNRYGVFNMLGNVSEIISDTLIKGINYYTPIFERQHEHKSPDGSPFSYSFSKKQIYNYKIDRKYIEPEPWLGFRCVCEVLEK